MPLINQTKKTIAEIHINTLSGLKVIEKEVEIEGVVEFCECLLNQVGVNPPTLDIINTNSLTKLTPEAIARTGAGIYDLTYQVGVINNRTIVLTQFNELGKVINTQTPNVIRIQTLDYTHTPSDDILLASPLLIKNLNPTETFEQSFIKIFNELTTQQKNLTLKIIIRDSLNTKSTDMKKYLKTLNYATSTNNIFS